MKQLNQRLARLENAAMGQERLIIAVGPDDFDVDLALASLGLEVGSSDLVVAVNGKPVGEPVTVTVNGVPVQTSGMSPGSVTQAAGSRGASHAASSRSRIAVSLRMGHSGTSTTMPSTALRCASSNRSNAPACSCRAIGAIGMLHRPEAS